MAIAGYNSSVLIASLPSVAFTDEATSTSDNITWTINNATKRYFDKSVATVVQEALDEIQTVTITGSPTGGTFTLTFGANTTTAIAYNATASAVQSALQALASIGAGNALVSGGPGPGTPYTVQFTSGLGQAGQSLLTATPSFTGGSSPNVSITRAQAGQAFGTVVDTNYTLFRANARIVFPSALGAGKYFRFHSGNYFPYAAIAEAASCEFSGKMGTEDTTVFNSSGVKNFTPTTLTGTLKYSSFWINNTRAQSLTNRDFLIVSFVTSTGNRYEGFCYASDCNIKDDVNKVVTQDLVFQLTDEFFNA